MARLDIEIAGDSKKLLSAIGEGKRALEDFNSIASKIKPINFGSSAKGGSGLDEVRAEAIRLSATIKDSLAESYNNARIATESARQVTEDYKQSLIDSKLAIDNQKQATEAQRTALTAARAEMASLTLESRRSKVSNEANEGSLISLRAKLSSLTKIYDSVSASSRNSAKIQGNLVPELQRISAEISKAEQATGRFQRQVGNYSKGLGNANGVTQEFTRIIQDAPFGMIGIGNNIQQLADNWRNYSIQAKAAAAANGTTIGTVGLLKGALTSLMTPASLLTLGIAVLTSAWTAYTMWSQKSAKATRENKEVQESFIETLNGLARAQADGQQNADKELVKLKLLYDATQDLTLPMEARRKSADELIKQYPKQLEGLSTEALLAGKASLAYDRLTKSITATALASAYANKMTDNAEKQLNNYLKILAKQNELNQTRAKILNQPNVLADESGTSSQIVERRRKALNDTNNFKKDEVRIQKELNDLAGENSVITKENTLLQRNYNQQLSNGADVDGKVGGDPKGKKPKDNKAEINKAIKDQKELEKISRQITQDNMSTYEAELDKALQKYEEIQSKVKDPDLLKLAQQNAIAEILKANIKQIGDFIDKLRKAKPLQLLTDTTIKIPDTTNRQNNDFTNLNRRQYTSSYGKDRMKEDDKLENRLSKVVESGFRKGITNILGSITELGSNFREVFTNVFQNLAGSINDIFKDLFATKLGNLMKSSFDDIDIAGLGNKASQALVAGLGVAGGLISGMTKKTSYAGQGIGGAVSGAAAGAALGPIGAIAGGVIGGIAGIFGAKSARKQEEIQRKQLEEQKKQTLLQERIASLTYASNIIGQRTSQGIVNGVDRNALGELTFRIDGRDLVATYKNETEAQKRGL